MGLRSKDLIPHKGSLIGFTGDTIIPKGYVDLKVIFGKKRSIKTVIVCFIVVDCPSAYNAITGRPTLNHLGAIVRAGNMGHPPRPTHTGYEPNPRWAQKPSFVFLSK
jgi:hypothetical protein